MVFNGLTLKPIALHWKDPESGIQKKKSIFDFEFHFKNYHSDINGF